MVGRSTPAGLAAWVTGKTGSRGSGHSATERQGKWPIKYPVTCKGRHRGFGNVGKNTGNLLKCRESAEFPDSKVKIKDILLFRQVPPPSPTQSYSSSPSYGIWDGDSL